MREGVPRVVHLGTQTVARPGARAAFTWSVSRSRAPIWSSTLRKDTMAALITATAPPSAPPPAPPAPPPPPAPTPAPRGGGEPCRLAARRAAIGCGGGARCGAAGWSSAWQTLSRISGSADRRATTAAPPAPSHAARPAAPAPPSTPPAGSLSPAPAGPLAGPPAAELAAVVPCADVASSSSIILSVVRAGRSGRSSGCGAVTGCCGGRAGAGRRCWFCGEGARVGGGGCALPRAAEPP